MSCTVYSSADPRKSGETLNNRLDRFDHAGQLLRYPTWFNLADPMAYRSRSRSSSPQSDFWGFCIIIRGSPAANSRPLTYIQLRSCASAVASPLLAVGSCSDCNHNRAFVDPLLDLWTKVHLNATVELNLLLPPHVLSPNEGATTE